MHWKLKAKLQNAFALLPPSASYQGYYLAQRYFGGLRKIRPARRMRTAATVWAKIIASGHDPVGKKFVEIGTGRVPFVPLAYWLMGADSCLSIDVNRYMRSELVSECVRYVLDSADEIREVLEGHLDASRLERLRLEVDPDHFSLDAFLNLCHIDYVAPGDAAHLEVLDETFDFHTSSNVLEHIPPEVLRGILEEGTRVTSRSGLSIHRIDYTDHFSHQDSSISRINFLKYSDEEWARYADNRYMYMNRLRHDDFLHLFAESGHEILHVETSVEGELIELLQAGGYAVAARFADKPLDVLATTGSWILSRPARR